ncbi:MAG TPA: formylglycine-generating enzyme family protein [Xanthobacteraceae bacterium]|nr:formylglycine-generating enzyme family protein [Xanthobacteraceae bacterium]
MGNGSRDCCASRPAGNSSAAGGEVSFGFPPHGEEVRRRWSAPIGGAFMMGTDDRRFPDDGEGPVREVTVSPFEIACHAVSNLQFGDFVRATGYTTDAERFGWSFVFQGLLSDARRKELQSRSAEVPWWIQTPHAYWAQPEGADSSVLDRLDHPAVHISWNDAKAYCHWSGTILPTEAQWEMAARGGLSQAIYVWGDELTPGGKHRCNIWQGEFPSRNTAEDGYIGTAPVHAFEPNGYGLHNVAGNVWEWCEDCFSPGYHRITASDNPFNLQPSPLRSLRGGSFLCHESYCNRYRAGARSSNTPDTSASNIGFRVVRASR